MTFATRPKPSSKPLRDAARQLLATDLPRANSLIVTVFGDSLMPHGGSVWLGSLIRLMEPLGLNERLVRTAVLRLSRDAWLTSVGVGRRSYYSLTEVGHRRFTEAESRIYAAEPKPWDGQWWLVLLELGALTADQRDRVRRDLGWLGFAPLSPALLVHPTPDRAGLVDALRDEGVVDQALVMQARSDTLPELMGGNGSLEERLRRFVAATWDLQGLAGLYRTFLDRFRPVLRTLQAQDDLDPEGCFVLRTLLIHEFRRILLKDPDLPAALLPPDWPGTAARNLARNLYLLTEGPAERHLTDIVETADGPLPSPAAWYVQRFGGLRPGGPLRAAAS